MPPSNNSTMDPIETGTTTAYTLIRRSSASLEALKGCSRQPLVAATKGEESIIRFMLNTLRMKESHAVRLTATGKQTIFVTL